MAEINSVPEYKSVNSPIKSPVDAPVNASPEDDSTDYNMVMSFWESSKKARKKYDQNWQTYEDFYNGKQWQKMPPSYRAAPNINVIRSTIETELPLLTDTSPGFDVIAKSPQDYQFSDTLSKSIRDWWNRRSMDHVVVSVLKDSLIYDYGVLKVVWDENLENGIGDINCFCLDPKDVWASPDAYDFDQNCDWVIHRMFKPVGELKRLFPESADKIKPCSNDKGQSDVDDKGGAGNVVLVSPTDKKTSQKDVKDVTGSTPSDYKTVEIIECWLRDYTTEEYELENEDNSDGGEKKTGTRLKFPNGRMITVIPGLKLVLQSKENPYKDAKFPFVRFVDNIRPREFCGQGEVEPLMETQRLLNKATSVIVDYLNQMVNPVWILDTNSGVDPDMLTNQVGLIINKNPGTDVRRETAPPLPAQVFEMYQMFQSLADQQSGINDVTQGRKPTGITAAEALQTMQEAAQTRIRLKQRNMEVSLSRMGELVVSRMLQFYTTPRVVRMVGDDAFWPTYFEFYITNNNDEKFQLNKREFKYNQEAREYEPSNDFSPVGEPTFGLFSVEVKGGTSLPFLKDKRGDLSMRLFQMGILDNQEVLNTLDWPRKEEVLKRVQQQQAQAAMSQ